MIDNCSAYILAGGKSERMGRNKALLEWDGVTFLENIYNSLKKIFKDVYIVVKKIDSFNKGKQFIEDLLSHYSPLTGIYTALKHTDKDYVFIKACDNPLISLDMIYDMYQYTKDYEIVVPKASDGLHPLYAFYSKKILPEVEKLIENENFRILSLYDELKVKYYVEDEIKKFDTKLVTLRNINTPVDLVNFRKFIKGER